MHSGRPHLFLIDGIGAVISTDALGYLLVYFNCHIGMPIPIRYRLASVAAVFAGYALTCAFIRPKYPRRYLQVLGIANLTYAFVTVFLLFTFRTNLTIVGFIYFAAEILILWVLSFLEIRGPHTHRTENNEYLHR